MSYVTAVFKTNEGNRCTTEFNNIRQAENWRELTDRVSPGFIVDWSIETHPEVLA